MSAEAKAAYEAFHQVRWPHDPIRQPWEKLSALLVAAWEAAAKAARDAH